MSHTRTDRSVDPDTSTLSSYCSAHTPPSWPSSRFRSFPVLVSYTWISVSSLPVMILSSSNCKHVMTCRGCAVNATWLGRTSSLVQLFRM